MLVILSKQGVERAKSVETVLARRGLPVFLWFSMATDFWTAFPVPLRHALAEILKTASGTRRQLERSAATAGCAGGRDSLSRSPSVQNVFVGTLSSAITLAVLLPGSAFPAAQTAAARVCPGPAAARSWERSSNPLPAENGRSSQPLSVESGTRKQPCALTW